MADMGLVYLRRTWFWEGWQPGKPLLFCFVLMPVVWIASLMAGEDPQVMELLKQGDAADAKADSRTALAHFQEADKLSPNDPAILARISKQYTDLIATEKSPADAAKDAQVSVEYAQRAVDLDPQSAKAHLALAIAYGKMTDFVDTKTRIVDSKHVRDEVLKSIELDPTDAYAYHVLGRWNYSIASLSPVTKLIAKYVYGGLPQASMEEAAANLKKATELAPQRIMHHFELARAYKALGKNDLATKEWQTVLALPANGKEDENDQKEAREELQKH